MDLVLIQHSLTLGHQNGAPEAFFAASTTWHKITLHCHTQDDLENEHIRNISEP